MIGEIVPFREQNGVFGEQNVPVFAQIMLV